MKIKIKKNKNIQHFQKDGVIATLILSDNIYSDSNDDETRGIPLREIMESAGRVVL